MFRGECKRTISSERSVGAEEECESRDVGRRRESHFLAKWKKNEGMCDE